MPALPSELSLLGDRDDLACWISTPEDHELRSKQVEGGWWAVGSRADEVISEASALGWRYQDEVQSGTDIIVIFSLTRKVTK